MAHNCVDFKRRQRCPSRFVTSCTDPNNADFDFNGLGDFEEGQIGTDPLDSDLDDDGSLDGVDTDPNNPNVQDDDFVSL